MTEHFPPRTEIVRDEAGRRVASADIAVVNEAARASLSVEAGHVPAGTREQLVDAVLDSPEVSASHQIDVAIPIGDADMLHRIRERCDNTESHTAGASCLIKAEVPNTSIAPDQG
ncbi:MAG: hypothetical protein QOI16_2585 [Pseudonocardiales bacterium]|nr:hypothetical protein [Pseudonocardiales bacterium]